MEYVLTVLAYLSMESNKNIEERAEKELKLMYKENPFKLLSFSKGNANEYEFLHEVTVKADSREEAEDNWFSLTEKAGFDTWCLKITKA